MQATNISVTQQNPLTQKPNLREGSSIFENFGPNFHEVGFKVIPTINKRPLFKFKQWIGHEQSEEALDFMIQKIKESNFTQEIGIAILGTKNICAIDIDIDDRRLLELCPPTPYICRGKKGWKLFYRHENLPNRPGTIHPVELLCEGRYFVVPPSPREIKEDGTILRYVYTGSDQEGIEYIKSINDLPMITMEDFDRLIEHCRKYKIMTNKVKNLNGGGENQVQRVHAEEGRNNILFSALCARIDDKAATVDEFTGKEESELAEWLVAYDQKLFPSNPWLTTDEGNNKYKGNAYAAALAFVHREVTRLKPKLVIGDQSKIVIPEHIKTTDEVYKEKVEVIDKETAQKMGSKELFSRMIASDEEWERLIPTAGVLRDCYNLYSERAINIVPQFGLAVGLSLQSLAASNILESFVRYKVKGTPIVNEIVTTPILYTMVTAPSGHGKNAVKSTISYVMSSIPEAGKLFKSELKSASGFMKGFNGSPRRAVLHLLDEYGKVAESAEGQKLAFALMEAYTSGNDFFAGGDAADKKYESGAMANYLATVIAMSTPEGLEKTVTEKFNSKGMLNRWLFMATNKKGISFAKNLKNIDTDYGTFDEFHSVPFEGSDFSGEAFFDPVESTNALKAKPLWELTDRKINSALYELLTAEVVYDPSYSSKVYSGGNRDNFTLTCPINCDRLLINSPEHLIGFGGFAEQYDDPAEVFHRMWLQAGNPNSFKPKDIRENIQAHSALKSLMVRASELINKLAFHRAINDEKVVNDILSKGRKQSRYKLAVLRTEHFEWAAKVYDLSLRGFLGLLGEGILGDKFTKFGIVGSDSNSAFEEILNIFETQEYDFGSMEFIRSRRALNNYINRHIGGDNVPFGKAIEHWKSLGYRIKFRDPVK